MWLSAWLCGGCKIQWLELGTTNQGFWGPLPAPGQRTAEEAACGEEGTKSPDFWVLFLAVEGILVNAVSQPFQVNGLIFKANTLHVHPPPPPFHLP